MNVTKVTLTVKPNSKTDLVQKVGDELVVRVKARAVDGKANETVIKLVADYLGLPKTHMQIKRGATGKHKVIEIDT
ncbi:DUF167 domain-containing protein [Candidatus Saccharibacteria bacterium]|nr:DUF167 domain-containing protein [Candidatus Saccharibacteria bacterium]